MDAKVYYLLIVWSTHLKIQERYSRIFYSFNKHFATIYVQEMPTEGLKNVSTARSKYTCQVPSFHARLVHNLTLLDLNRTVKH